MEPASFRTIIHHKIADQLDGKPDGLHVDELAKHSGVDKNKLYRILRFLATKHVFTEGGLFLTIPIG